MHVVSHPATQPLGASKMHSNTWTTAEEFKYLDSLVPKFLAGQENCTVGPWLTRTATEFLKRFPACAVQYNCEQITMVLIFSHSTHISHSYRSLTLQKIRTWYGNHTRDCVRGTDSRHVLDLSGKANRRPLPLQPAQAYPILYHAKGTPLYQEIHDLHNKYKAGDETTVAKLTPLFDKSLTPETLSLPASAEDDTTTPQSDTTALQTNTAAAQSDAISLPSNNTTPSEDTAPPEGTAPTGKQSRTRKPAKAKTKTKTKTKSLSDGHVPKFVVFQQAIIHEKLKTVTDVETAAIEALIKECYDAAMKIWESPWLSLAKGQEQALDIELENKFYQRYVFHP